MQRGSLQELALQNRRQTFYIEMIQIKGWKSASSYLSLNMPLHKIPGPFRTFVVSFYGYLKRTRHFDTFRRQQLHLQFKGIYRE